MPTAEEFAALQKALAQATAQQQEAADRHAALIGELRITRAERDLAYFGECDRSFRRIVTGGLRGDFSTVSAT